MSTSFRQYSLKPIGIIATVCVMLISIILFLCMPKAQAEAVKKDGERLVTIHDRGEERVILTHAHSVDDALKEANISLDTNDAVEPGRESELIDTSYNVNIYRARPVVVSDGAIRQKGRA